MKKIDLNNLQDLIKFKDSLSKVIDNRITEMTLSEKIDSIDNMPFGALKALFESVSADLYETAKGQKLIGKYASTIKNSKELKPVYQLYESIAHPSNITNPQMFINEAIELVRINNKKAYADDMAKLSKIMKEAVKEISMTTEEIDKAVATMDAPICESLDYLLKNKKSMGNLAEYVNNMANVTNTLSERLSNVKEDEPISESYTMEDLKATLSEGLQEWEKDLVEQYTVALLSESSKKDLFESYKNDCISLIDESLESEEENNETRSQLSAMKEQLSAIAYDEATLLENLLNLADLKHTLQD